MVRVFVTGSADGIGLAIAQQLLARGADVTLHARNATRAQDLRTLCPSASSILTGDLSSVAETKAIATQANELPPFDAIIHNAGINADYGESSSKLRTITPDGVSTTFAVNTLSFYILACLMKKPTKRILFMSSDSHYSGSSSLASASQTHSYGDSKLHDVMLANAFAKRWHDVQVLSMHPGWVRTKMGGRSASLDGEVPGKVVAEWAMGEGDFTKLRSGAFVYLSGERKQHEAATDAGKQDELLNICEKVSGVELSENTKS